MQWAESKHCELGSIPCNKSVLRCHLRCQVGMMAARDSTPQKVENPLRLENKGVF